ncbi:MAG: hypothetical protein ACE5KI_08465, partial [Dehalococcoidia bacterium]
MNRLGKILIALIVVLLVASAACKLRDDSDATSSPEIPGPAETDVVGAEAAEDTPTPSAPTTPTPQKVEPHIPFPTPTPTPDPSTQVPAQADDLVETFEAELSVITSQVIELRGLPSLEETPFTFLTSQELRELIQADLLESYPPEESQIDQELYLALDFLDEDDDLFQMVSDLYSEQVVGFYDTDEKAMFIVSDREDLGPNEKLTFAHELTHALQDQHFDLDAFLPEDEENADRQRARLALVEGDATLSQSVYAVRHLSQEELLQLGVVTGEFTAFRQAAKILQEDLVFPYSSGTDFVSVLFGRGGWTAIDGAYQSPPESTEQVLHPERYRAGDSPVEVIIPGLVDSLEGEWLLLDSGVLGEFMLKVYLENFLSINGAAGAAEGWGGDSYKLLKQGPEGERLLVVLSVWDTEPDAVEFFDAYVGYIDEKGNGEWPLTLSEEEKRWWN